MNVRILTVMMAAAMAMTGVTAWADVDEAGPATPAVDPLVPKVEDPFAGLMDIDPAELEKAIANANKRRLTLERELAIAEMENKMYSPTAMDEATRILRDKPLDTQADNIDRIVRAYARLDKKFGDVYKLYSDKKYAEAAAKAEPLVNEQSTYLNASAAYIRAVCLEQTGNIEDAADAYSLILSKIYDRVSFACESSIRMAAMFERNGRGMYAMQAYAYLLRNYSLTLDLDTIDEILRKLEKMTQTYGDPLGTVAKLMGDVKERLYVTDSGQETRDKQQEIIALLDDLIRVAQDQQCQSECEGQKKDQKPCEGEGESQGKKPGEGQGNKASPNPSKPAADSVLRAGDTSRAARLSEEYKSDENSDWAALPPEKRAQLQEQIKRLTSERQESTIRDTRRAVSEGR
ncbi:MAG: hypothetical protein FWE88_04280 [Phycisphaerae bacterium]|nr:hypothetical protein [Phycisphaerae bacterium]